jgi:hypothetical protein
VGPLEVPTLCLWLHDFSLDLGYVLLNGSPLEQLMVRGSRVSNLLSLVLYPKRVHFASLMLPVRYWRPRRSTPLTKGIIISPECVALNYPHPVM